MFTINKHSSFCLGRERFWESEIGIKRDRKKRFQTKEMQAHDCSFKPLQF